jgi:hypothetical protein
MKELGKTFSALASSGSHKGRLPPSVFSFSSFYLGCNGKHHARPFSRAGLPARHRKTYVKKKNLPLPLHHFTEFDE